MNPVLQHLLDTNFKDLAGTQGQGVIKCNDALINLALQDVINGLLQPEPTATAAPTPPSSPAAPDTPDPKVLLRALTIEKLQYRTEEGRTVLDFKVAVKEG